MRNLSSGSGQPVIKSNLKNELERLNQSKIEASIESGRRMNSRDRDRIVYGIVKQGVLSPDKAVAKQRMEERSFMLEQMKRSGDDTFQEQDLPAPMLDKTLRNQARRPLFEESAVPGI